MRWFILSHQPDLQITPGILPNDREVERFEFLCLFMTFDLVLEQKNIIQSKLLK